MREFKTSTFQNNNFSITFPNGYSVSVLVGKVGVYCTPDSDGFSDAECAVRGPDNKFYRMPGWYDDVKGWMNASEILELMIEVATL